MSANNVLALVQALQAAVALARELGLSFAAVSRKAAELDAAGKEFTIADAHEFVAKARADLDRLDAAIREARESGLQQG